MYMGISEFAKRIGVSVQTLRLWDASGRLKPHHLSEGKHRMYSEDQVTEYFGDKYDISDIKEESFVNLSKKNMKRVIDNYRQMLSYLEDIYEHTE